MSENMMSPADMRAVMDGSGLTQMELQQGVDTQEITRKLDGLSYGLADGFYAVNNILSSRQRTARRGTF